MANGVWHTKLKIEILLDEDDLGHPEIPDLWERLRADRRPVEERGLQCLECREERPHCPEWMYLREHSEGSREAVHFNTSISAHPSAKESDDHKALKERIATAGEQAGFPVDIEDRAPDGKRRTDATVIGDNGLRVGWEVQRSSSTSATVQKRSATARGDGLTPSWVTSAKKLSEVMRQTAWSLVNHRPWQEVRSGKEIRVAGGARTLEMEHCSRIPGPCPVKKRGKCNDWHGRWEVYNPTLDELVRDTAAGAFVPIIDPTTRFMNRFWVPAADRDIFAESVGGLPTEDDLRRKRVGLRQSSINGRELDRICRYGQVSDYRSPRRFVADQGQTLDASAVTIPASTATRPAIAPPPTPKFTRYECSAGVTPCGAPARLYPCGWRCDDHSPAAMRRREGA